jgi:hypothetical protein
MVLTDTQSWRRLVTNAKWSHESEIIRAKAIIAELTLNNEKSHQLIHTQRNLLTVQQLLLEQIHRTSCRALQPQASIPRLTTASITKEMGK